MNGGLAQGSAAQNVLEWRVKKAKLALAFAVIKSRPPGKSGRLQAEDLAVKLRSQDEALRTKAQGLQEEVLRLRQELLLTKLLSNQSKPQNEAGDSCTEVFSQDLMGSFNDQPNTDMDSGCGTENSTEALLSTGSCTDTSVPQSLQPAVSGPQLPSVSPSEGCPQGKALLLHMHFLQSVCALRRVGCEGGVHAAELSASDSSVVGDSVCQLLSSVVGICRDSLPPLPLLRQAACVAAQAVEYWGPLGRPPEPIVIQGEDTLKELLGVLLHNDQLNRCHVLTCSCVVYFTVPCVDMLLCCSQVQETLTSCLILLGGSSLLKSLLIRHVLSEIDRVADHLWHTCQGESNGPELFDVALYENSFYLFWILEQLLQGGAGTRGGPGGQGEQPALDPRTEDRVGAPGEPCPASLR
ncbi:meiosis-specific protein MEI4 [Hypomesus transpacificus]|uniref:meiosis-specific protein MEI4 n=1 Tax=Hypomesus transpacificus TaxID=137520 RepID=UPI001F07C7D4|nr:meiosis-specific protein MEI4 [Hypomesus transpacificus]